MGKIIPCFYCITFIFPFQQILDLWQKSGYILLPGEKIQVQGFHGLKDVELHLGKGIMTEMGGGLSFFHLVSQILRGFSKKTGKALSYKLQGMGIACPELWKPYRDICKAGYGVINH